MKISTTLNLLLKKLNLNKLLPSYTYFLNLIIILNMVILTMFLNYIQHFYIYFNRGVIMDFEYNYDNFKDMSCNNFITYLLSLSATELTILASILGFLLAQNIDANKQNSLGNFFELIGQTLLTISAQNIELQPSFPSRQQLQQEINYLKKEIEILKNTIL